MTIDTSTNVVPAPPPQAADFLRTLAAMHRLPVTANRIQLTPSFTFDHARECLPYLSRLGITDLYCSPFFRAKPGSTHGYDVCDFSEFNPELGGEPAFTHLSDSLQELQMGLLLDFVPNHMAVDAQLNPWWRDMLEHGPSSPFARYFDVDWKPVKAELKGKILLPFLGDHYGHVLERGELLLIFDSGSFGIRYYSMVRPVDPRQYPRILRLGLEELQAEMGEDVHLAEFLSILTALEHLPKPSESDPERIAERLRESKLAKERLARIVEVSPPIRRHIDNAVSLLNGTPGDPDSFDALHELLEALPFRLANWKTAVHEINYRRFFDINELAGLRVEEPAAFQAMHQLVSRLIRDGRVTGLRLDHIDGLFNPSGYCKRLQSAVLTDRIGAYLDDPDDVEIAASLLEWSRLEETQQPQGLVAKPLNVVVEKILSGSEMLPDWPVGGTTGYDFMNDVTRLFVNPRNAQVLRRCYQSFTGLMDPFPEIVYDCKKLITWTSLASELNVLAHALNRLSEKDRQSRDFTLDSLRETLREVAVAFPVYRSYVGPNGATDADRQVIDQAIHRARRRNPAMEASVFDFVRSVLLPNPDGISIETYEARLRFAMKFQQYTSPLQAKGIEDTAFYRYNVLLSLNEVGGDPQRFGGTIPLFHQANQLRHTHAPHGLLSTATHDTKRGEDARTRISVLSEVPGTWRKRVRRWAEINADCRSIVDELPAPDRNDEYLFYQTLIGIWPSDITEPIAPAELVTRMKDYLQKAIKEAKVHTSWITPNEAYDQACTHFVEQVLTGLRSREFLTRFLPFQRRIARAGMVNSLAQLVLKLTSPGSPDFYQGTELWDLNLVDPDNRRPVDYVHRQELLRGIEPWLDHRDGSDNAVSQLRDWFYHWEDGRIKMALMACGCRLRREKADLFLHGDYVPLPTSGPGSDHVISFARQNETDAVIVAVPRLCLSFQEGTRTTWPLGREVWSDTSIVLPASLPNGKLRNVFTGETIAATSCADGSEVMVASLFQHLPVAMVQVVSE